MQNEPTAAQMEMLTPGSIWKRKSGAVSRFLFLTNDSIPAEHQDRFPQMAVFADDEDNILSLPLEDFLANRKFHHVDGDLETRLLDLLDDEDDGDTQQDLDDGDDNDGNDDDSFDIDGITAAVAGEDAPFIKFTTENPTLPALLDPLMLAGAVIGYSQMPLLSERRVSHTLTIAALPNIDAQSLHNSFSPARVELNQVFSFEVRGPEGLLDIDWDEFAGLFTSVSADHGPFWSLVFYTKLNVATLEDTDAEAAPDFVVQQDESGKNTISVAQADTDTFVIDNTAAPARAVLHIDTGDKPASADQLAALQAQFASAPIPAGTVIQAQSGAGQTLVATTVPVAAPATVTTLADDSAPAVKNDGFMIG